MFTADGELRQAFQHLDQDVAEQAAESSAPVSHHPSSEVATEARPVSRQEVSAETFGGEPASAEQPVSFEQAAAEQAVAEKAFAEQAFAEQAMESEPIAGSGEPEPEEVGEDDGPGFIDLVRLLAEHASIYIMQSRAASPVEASENLEVARLHIDLLAVLEKKTRGNLSSNEQALLDDAIRQLRAGLVGLQG